MSSKERHKLPTIVTAITTDCNQWEFLRDSHGQTMSSIYNSVFSLKSGITRHISRCLSDSTKSNGREWKAWDTCSSSQPRQQWLHAALTYTGSRCGLTKWNLQQQLLFYFFLSFLPDLYHWENELSFKKKNTYTKMKIVKFPDSFLLFLILHPKGKKTKTK